MGCCGSAPIIDESSVISRVKVARYMHSSVGIGRMESYAPGVIHTDGNLLEYDSAMLHCCLLKSWRRSFPVANIETMRVQSKVLTIKVEKNGIHYLINAVVVDSDANMDHFIETVTRLSSLTEKTVSYDEQPPPYTPTNTTSQYVSRLQ